MSSFPSLSSSSSLSTGNKTFTAYATNIIIIITMLLFTSSSSYILRPLLRTTSRNQFHLGNTHRSSFTTLQFSPSSFHNNNHNNLQNDSLSITHKRSTLYPPFSHILHSSTSTSLSSSTSPSTEGSGVDTVFALSSGGGGEGGMATAVAVIRISGPNSVAALDLLMNPIDKKGEPLLEKTQKIPKARYAAVRTLYEHNNHDGDDDDTTNNANAIPLDQALVLYFPGPNSFTGEDIIELHTHGSRAVVADVLRTLESLPSSSSSGLLLRPADRGEFTQRAYTNGKLGLVEVEALADLIVSDTAMQRRQALLQLDGRVTKVYDNWRIELIKGLAHAEAVIDFGDDEDLTEDDEDGYDENDDTGENLVWGNVRTRVGDLLMNMKRFLQDDNRGEIVRDGVKIAIVGPPNAGKSSLLNALARRDVAIVSPIAGTTRDVVEVVLDLGGVRCIVSDTAGVREETGGDIIEEEGIRRATKVAQEAHVVLFMEDAVSALEEESSNQKNTVEGIIGLSNKDFNGCMMKVKNKIDLLESSQIEQFLKSTTTTPEFGISCSTGSGLDKLLDNIEQVVMSRVSGATSSSGTGTSEDGLIITRARHRRHIQETVAALSRFMELTEVTDLMTVDLAAEELRLATSELGRITGAVDVEEVLDVLFADFCIGK